MRKAASRVCCCRRRMCWWCVRLEKIFLGVERDHIRMIYIKSTLSLETIMVSEALLDEVRARSCMELLSELRPLGFDKNGALLDFS